MRGARESPRELVRDVGALLASSLGRATLFLLERFSPCATYVTGGSSCLLSSVTLLPPCEPRQEVRARKWLCKLVLAGLLLSTQPDEPSDGPRSEVLKLRV